MSQNQNQNPDHTQTGRKPQQSQQQPGGQKPGQQQQGGQSKDKPGHQPQHGDHDQNKKQGGGAGLD